MAWQQTQVTLVIGMPLCARMRLILTLGKGANDTVVSRGSTLLTDCAHAATESHRARAKLRNSRHASLASLEE